MDICTDLRCHAVSDDTGCILSSCTALPLLGTAVNERTDLYTLADIQKADSLGPVDLMAAGSLTYQCSFHQP